MSQEMHYDATRAWSTLIVVILGTLMSILDSTVLSVALPTVMNVFGITLTSAQWITTCYTLTMAIVIPLTPYLSRVFGSERVYMVAIIVFTISSFLCGFSWNLSSMIVFRVLQALGGGMMSPIGMGMVMTLFPPHKRGMAFGVYGIAAMAAPAFGPTLGGYIVEYLGWRYVFYINIPIGIIAVFLATIFFEFRTRIPFPKFDIRGFVSAAIASIFILYLVGENDNIDWSTPRYIYMLIIGIGAFVYFVVNELYEDEPLLDLRMFKYRNYTVSIVLTTIQMLMMLSISYTMPMFLQRFKGLSAMSAGEVLLPSSLVMAFVMPFTGKITDKVGLRGTKYVVAIGISICGISTLYISTLMNVNSSISSIVIVSSIRNIGLGLSMMPVRTLGLADIPQKDMQKATAMQTFVQQFSSAILVTIVTYIITARFNYNYANATSQLTSFNIPLTDTIKVLVNSFMAKGLSATDATSKALSTVLQGVYVDNYILAMQYTIFVCAIVGTMAILAVPLFKVKDN